MVYGRKKGEKKEENKTCRVCLFVCLFRLLDATSRVTRNAFRYTTLIFQHNNKVLD